MRFSAARLSIAAAVVSAPLAASLFVAPNSPCSKYCGNVLASTAADEMVCDAGALALTSPGHVWEECIGCLLTSTYVSGAQTDLQALLYNLRFNMGHCLFDGETNPCVTATACEMFEDAVKYQNMTTAVGPYDYCQKWEQNMVSHCGPCLTQLEDGIYQNNYLMILEAACEQKPAPGSTVSIDGDPFGTDSVVIVAPQETYASVPAPDYGPVSLGARVGIAFGGLAFVLAMVGFCIVCNGKRRRRAYLRELERRHGAQNWPHPKSRYGGGGTDMFETPVSQKPLRGWENESPVSAHTDGAFPRYFSPYSSNYNSPVTGPEGPGPSNARWPSMPTQQQIDQLIQTQSPIHGSPPPAFTQSPVHGSPPPAFTQWPSIAQEKTMMQAHAHHEKRQNELAIGLALGGDEASLRSKASNLNLNGYPVESKGKERDEAYEMHEVESPYGNGNGNANGDATGRQYEYPYRMPAEPQAPVLHHPGYGRHHESRPGSGGTAAVAGAAGLGLGEYGAGQAQRGGLAVS
ncbi:hypothetical protein C8A00DRAFT_32608 [Chaetomidium leptoderma]|uniref:Uncharacterized protein n=1 Tax=Chaetomidium leptoderma TaxID=669021 RepID=A0AAN6VQK3_9PEZI|nr:hypothetical protein C8A00DRAFT_32608 [Chaetomidium leptoderma]